MLTLNLKSGEYLTIGKDIAVRVVEQPGSSFQVSVKAPRELQILRGEVLERTEKRPAGLSKQAPKSAAKQTHDAKQLQKMAEKKARVEAERRQIVEEQAAVTKQLKDILIRMDALADSNESQVGMKEILSELELLHFRLDGLVEVNREAKD